MSHGPEPGGGGGGGVAVDWVHCWLVALLQVQRMILVPLVVAAALASRHRPDCTPVMVPPELMFHCWLVWPLQSQMMTWVPLVVPRALASRHLVPKICSCLLVV